MKQKDIFNLAVRILGLVFLYQGLAAVPAGVSLVGFSVKQGITIYGPLVPSVLTIFWLLVLAWWLIGGAPLITNRAYPEDAANKIDV